MNESIVRESLVVLLLGEQAHVGAKKALADVKPELRHVQPPAGTHSVWEELEHMRLAQEDILRYTLEASWKSPRWPEGYWPSAGVRLTDRMWDASVSGFFSDLQKLIDLVKDSSIDLTATIPHGEGHTYLREALLVADHNAYHLGQIVQTRKALGDWSG